MPTLPDDDLDFLGEPASAAVAAIELVRGELIDWAAKALHRRCPAAAVYPGNKGLVQCRLDLDRHLKQLLDVPLDSALIHLTQYRAWVLTAVWLPRGSTAETLAAGAEVLAEALVRFVPLAEIAAWAAVLRQAMGCSDPIAAARIAQRCATF